MKTLSLTDATLSGMRKVLREIEECETLDEHGNLSNEEAEGLRVLLDTLDEEES